MTKPLSQVLSTAALVVVALGALLAGCARVSPDAPAPDAPLPNAAPDLLEVRATSRTSLTLTFSGPVGADLAQVDAYRITAPDGDVLEVLAAYADGAEVTLATAPQQLVGYRLSVLSASADAPPIATAFEGAAEAAPAVASAIALSNTQVLVTFVDPASGRPAPMDANADTPLFYALAPRLPIRAANRTLDGSAVVLVTESQEDRDYTLEVTNVKSADGGRLVDPDANEATFRGIAVRDTTAPTLRGAVALSATEVLVSFSEPLSEGADDARHYTVTGGAGAPLTVRSVVLNAFRTQATLTTTPQTPGAAYTLAVSGLRDASGNPMAEGEVGFEGYDNPRAPTVASAIALSNSQVLVTFVDPETGEGMPMGDAAEITAFYEFSPHLDVGAARLGLDRTTVVLTTSPQAAELYRVKVTNVASRDGGRLIDAGRNAATFQGVPPFDGRPPDVTGAVATSNTTVVVSYSEPVAPGAGDVGSYRIADGLGDPLVVTNVVLNAYGTQATLTTLPQHEASYTVTVSGVSDLAGNPLAVDSATFQGVDADAPRLLRAVALSSTRVQLTFSEALGASAEVASNYLVATPDLTVSAATLSADRTQVDLTTGVQASLPYRVEVVDVRDEAGNLVDAEHAAAGFYGRLPADDGADTDGDGLSDYAETNGVTLRSGEVVLLDPERADTDGDARSDGDEVNVACGGAYSHPQWRDTDGDGVDDGAECAGGTDPTDPTASRLPDAPRNALAIDVLGGDDRVHA